MENIKKPSLFWYFTEGVRSFIEYIQCLFFLRSYPFKTIGDGHPVLVVPGLICTDFSTRLLRKFINKLGYTAYGWELGRNMGNLKDLRDLKRLQGRIDIISKKHNNQKLTLIGWSMGGIYVREIAKMHPEMFDQVITMGSPFADTNAPTNVTWFYNLIANPNEFDKKWLDNVPNPASIRTTAIYSKQDGLVPWQVCREKVEDNLHQNIEVKGSHWGFVVNKKVLNIIAEHLAFSQINIQINHNNIKKAPYLSEV